MIIGITGSFGSGKTTVARLLAKKCKSKVIDADRVARKLIRTVAWKEIKRNFPNVLVRNKLNRKKLAEIVFSDKQQLRKLENILHPLIIRKIKKEIRKSKNVIIDAPLLIETKLHKKCDVVIVVTAGKEEIKRLTAKGFTKEEIIKRKRNQMSFKKKKRYADFIVYNKNIKDTERQVEKIWAAFS